MQSVRIKGRAKLQGKVAISGSKNSGLPLLAASLLTDEPVVLTNVPQLNDIRFMLQLLEFLGCETTFEQNQTRVRALKIHGNPSYELVKQMRASICLLGPLIARLGHAEIPLPGGCVIGQRPIDLHLRGLQKLGCDIRIQNGVVCASATHLRGTNIFLGGRQGSTVTGTANILCAATRAKGITTIQSAACEPEIIDLCHLLLAMGAKIEGIGSPTLIIEGVDSLHGASHRLIPDRIEYGTFFMLALMTRSAIQLPPLDPCLSGALLYILEQSGARWEENADGILVRGDRSSLNPVELTTLPFPGFSTDLQAQMCALMTQVEGVSVITERIYPSRFMHISELGRMGADILLEGSSAIIKGATTLSGAPIMASDLRAGASLYMAGLAAEGETIVQRVYHVDRGYEKLDEKLCQLGAEIERFDDKNI